MRSVDQSVAAVLGLVGAKASGAPTHQPVGLYP